MSAKLTPGGALWEVVRNVGLTWLFVACGQQTTETLRTICWMMVGFFGVLTLLSIGGLGIALDRYNKTVNKK